MTYTKPVATRQHLSGLMIKGSICCVDKRCPQCG